MVIIPIIRGGIFSALDIYRTYLSALFFATKTLVRPLSVHFRILLFCLSLVSGHFNTVFFVKFFEMSSQHHERTYDYKHYWSVLYGLAPIENPITHCCTKKVPPLFTRVNGL